jgi:hypothetical protein
MDCYEIQATWEVIVEKISLDTPNPYHWNLFVVHRRLAGASDGCRTATGCRTAV